MTLPEGLPALTITTVVDELAFIVYRFNLPDLRYGPQKEGQFPCIFVKPFNGCSQVPQGLSMTPPIHPGGPGGRQDQGHEVST